MSAAGPVIILDRVSRWYGQVLGLNHVSCRFGPGITALLGPNGAGKSTLLKLVTGQLRPTTGRISVFGRKPFANPAVFRRLGYCPEIENCYDEMTGREFVSLLAALAGLRGKELKRRVDEVIELVGMTAQSRRAIGGYSKGMRQRIKLAQALVHEPELLVLDEPLNGLDPVGRRQISDLLRAQAQAGRAVVVSSHILHEVEQLTSQIVLIHRGRLRAQGDVYTIRRLIDQHPHRVSVETPDTRRLAARLVEQPYVSGVRFFPGEDGRVEVETRSPESFYREFPRLVLADGIRIDAFHSPDNNLEAVFHYLVGE